MPGYNKVVLSGTLASGAEIWSTGVAFSSVEGPVTLQGDCQAWANGIAAGLSAFIAGTTSLESGLSGNGAITETRVYYYPTTDGPATAVGVAAGNTVGTGAGNQPLQSSAVLSLRTGVAGRRTRGRMYWPALAIAPNNFGVYSAATAGAMVSDAVLLLEFLREANPVSSNFYPAVVSKVGNLVTPVTTVSVGNVPDTQRRRRNGLVETYYTQVL